MFSAVCKYWRNTLQMFLGIKLPYFGRGPVFIVKCSVELWYLNRSIFFSSVPLNSAPRANPVNAIGDFWVAFRLCFKETPGANPFYMEMSFIHLWMNQNCLWIKLISIWKASHWDLLWSRGEIQLGNRLFAFTTAYISSEKFDQIKKDNKAHHTIKGNQ